MRLFVKEHSGEARLCVVSGEKYLDLKAINEGQDLNLKEVIGQRETLERLRLSIEEADEKSWTPLGTLTFLPPLPKDARVICVASNYRAHIAESGRDAPSDTAKVTPRLFIKPSTCLTGHDSSVVLPRDSVAVDWEIELGVVIGQRAKRVKVEEAQDYIFGYTVLNDISERKFHPGERTHTLDFDRFFDWQHGKWHDTFAPCGPYLVTADEVDAAGLDLGLKLNGKLMQEGNTSEMIIGIHELIAFISRVMTLEPGDIIATGTPSGVGNAKGVFLQPGDKLEGWVEGIGVLKNNVIAEDS